MFTALLVVALWKFDVVLGVLKTIWDIIFPFVLGGSNRISYQCTNELFGKENF